jgi:hypothetical protein
MTNRIMLWSIDARSRSTAPVRKRPLNVGVSRESGRHVRCGENPEAKKVLIDASTRIAAMAPNGPKTS